MGTVGRRRRTRRAEPPHARAGRRAATLVRDGETVSCGRELAVAPPPTTRRPRCTTCSPPVTSPRGRRACRRRPTSSASSFHGMAVSHIDALCHVFVDGQMYNGFPASDVTSLGARRNSIEAAFGGIVGRGVLLDIPRLRGVEWLEPGDVDHARRARRRVRRARRRRRAGRHPARRRPAATRGARQHGPWDPNQVGLAGLDPECIPWLREHDPAVLGSDGVSDVLPAEPARVADARSPVPARRDGRAPARQPAARPARRRLRERGALGVPVRGAPLQIGGGTGSPVNPVAVCDVIFDLFNELRPADHPPRRLTRRPSSLLPRRPTRQTEHLERTNPATHTRERAISSPTASP